MVKVAQLEEFIESQLSHMLSVFVSYTSSRPVKIFERYHKKWVWHGKWKQIVLDDSCPLLNISMLEKAFGSHLIYFWVLVRPVITERWCIHSIVLLTCDYFTFVLSPVFLRSLFRTDIKPRQTHWTFMYHPLCSFSPYLPFRLNITYVQKNKNDCGHTKAKLNIASPTKRK